MINNTEKSAIRRAADRLGHNKSVPYYNVPTLLSWLVDCNKNVIKNDTLGFNEKTIIKNVIDNVIEALIIACDEDNKNGSVIWIPEAEI